MNLSSEQVRQDAKKMQEAGLDMPPGPAYNELRALYKRVATTLSLVANGTAGFIIETASPEMGVPLFRESESEAMKFNTDFGDTVTRAILIKL